jgi:hypothetical protein
MLNEICFPVAFYPHSMRTNSRDQKEGETIEQYITVLRTLAQSCNFCTCLGETLLRDRVVLAVKDNSVRKRLLQE